MSCRGSLVLAVLVAACSQAPVVAQAPRVPPAKQQAVGKLVRAVEKAPELRSEAVSLLQQAVAEDPILWEARYNLGVLLALQGRLDASGVQLREAQQLAPNAEDVVVALAEVLRRDGRSGEAVDILFPFVRSFPKAFAARVVLAGVLRLEGKAKEAIEHGRALVLQRPGNADALAELALSHLAYGEVEIANLLVQQALAVVPRRAIAERAAGQIAFTEGDDALAFSHFSKATALDPKDTAAGLSMAVVLLRAGVYQQAEQRFRHVLESEPESRRARIGLAASLRGQGDRDTQGPLTESEKILLALLQEQPEDWIASHNLALLYAASLQDGGKALDHYKRYLARAPADHWARQKAEQWVEEYKESPPATPASSNIPQ